MKQSLFILVVMAISLIACAQTPPQPVTKSFNSKFPGATNIKWDQEEENEWEAGFKMNGSKMTASFDNAGKWLETESKLKKSDLPGNVMSAVSEAYKDWKIESVESIETPEMKAYELGLEKGKEEMEIQITPEGKITVKKEAGEDESDEK